MRLTTRACLLTSFALAGAGFLPAVATAGSAPDGSGAPLTILDPGVEPRVVLPGSPAVGMGGTDTKSAQSTGTIVATGDENQEIVIDVTTAVVQTGRVLSVEPDGGFVMLRTVESFDVVDNSDEGEGDSYVSDPELGDVVGVALEVTYDAQGAIVAGAAADGATLDAVQQAALEAIMEDGAIARFPLDAVGVGARWTVDVSDDGTDGMTATYTLTALEGDEYTIDVALKGDATDLFTDLPNGIDTASGTITGTGSLVGHVGNPFDRESQVTTEFDLTLSGPGIEVVSDITLAEQQVTVPD